jgi:hypothetical protein
MKEWYNLFKRGMKNSNKKIPELAIWFTVFCVALGFFAASPALALSPESIFVDVVPEHPAPNEETTISLRSFSANLDIVSISWLVNGRPMISGIGKKSFSVTAGAVGTNTTVTANIFLPEGQITKTVVLRPATTTLLWQATDSYTPPFYKGRAIPTPGSSIKVVAMPEAGGSKNMTYSWEKDYSAIPEASGYGKSHYTYTHDIFDNMNTVTVETLSVDQKFASSARVTVVPKDPEILFYRDDPEMGIIWEDTFSNYEFITGPVVVVAAPYFISPKDLWRGELDWEWYINDKPVDRFTAIGNVLPLQIEEGTSGTAKLRLEVDNIAKFLQTATKEIKIQF